MNPPMTTLRTISQIIPHEELSLMLSISPQTLSRWLKRDPAQIPTNTLTLLTLISENLRNCPTLPDVSFLLPHGLKPQFRWAAMHSVARYSWAWSAFTTQPKFNFKTGYWEITGEEPQILLSNHEYIPYDQAGPEYALYLRTADYNIWKREPLTYDQNEIDALYQTKHPTESVPPPAHSAVKPETAIYPGTTNIFSKKVMGLINKKEVNRR